MKEKKRNKVKRYEVDMLEHAKKMIGQTSFFSCMPKVKKATRDEPY